MDDRLAFKRSLDDPDERRRFDRIELQFVRLGHVSIVRSISQPGWRWSTDVHPKAGTDTCQVHHRGICISGHLRIEMEHGQVLDLLAGDVYEVPPGHDGSMVGDVPVVLFEISSVMNEFGQTRVASGCFRRCSSLTSWVPPRWHSDSATRPGNGWGAARRGGAQRGRAFPGTRRGHHGDGVFARFDGAARALYAALAIRDATSRLELPLRIGVHRGEIEVAGGELRGLAIHEASRIMGAAGAGGILASELTTQLASGSGLRFGDRGETELRGVSGKRRLLAVVG